MMSGIYRPDKISMKSIQDAEMSKNIGQGGGGGRVLTMVPSFICTVKGLLASPGV
jgi:hypothetical protein